MILGSRMEHPSGSGRDGIRIQDCILRDRGLRLVSALESDTLAGLGGDGTTGDLIGITTTFVSIITTTSPTAEFSPIETASITAADFTAGAFTAACLPAGEASARPTMDSHRHTPSQVRIPVHSAALIMEELPEAFPLAVSRASAEASTEAAVSTEVEVVTVEEAVTGKRASITANTTHDLEKESCALRIRS